MSITSRFMALAMLALSGCTITYTSVPDAEKKACDVLAIAFDEAQMAPAWYTQAGEVLESCGMSGAREEAIQKSCYAEAWNGYRNADECEVKP